MTASPEIIKEYLETTDYLLNKYQGQDIRLPLMQIITNINIIADSNDVQICRDPDDNKFLSCAVNSNSYYIISGDKDLLDLKKYEEIQIVTVAEFLEIFYLNNK